MTTVLELRFPAGQYHATPWAHHVNEGVVEWPPSPFRILRALLATGFTKLGWPPDGPPPIARRLIERLASCAPDFALPTIGLGHSRHYVDAEGKKPLILDAFAWVGDGVVEVRWPIELDSEERRLLDELARNLGYLGRAESWVEARLVSSPVGPRNDLCSPSRGGPRGPGWEPVRVLLPVTAEAYAEWRAEQVGRIEAEHSSGSAKLSKAAQQKLAKALAPYPVDLIAALCVDTGVLQAQGWTAAPGSQEQVYYRRASAQSTSVPTRVVPSRLDTPRHALFALATPSRSESALPPLHRVFPQGRLFHRALASVIGKRMAGDPVLAAMLLGREGGGPSRAGHRHAHLLHLDLGGTQRLDHVLVWVPGGIDERAQEALAWLRSTYMKGGVGELQVSLAGLGDAEMMRRTAPPYGDALVKVLGPRGGAIEWVSATPYVAPRFVKPSGKDTIEGQVRADCASRGLPSISAVELLAPDVSRAMRHFVLSDERYAPPQPVRHGVRIRFEAPVEGPICLGYGAHAGLGRFEAVS
jgi:CRISPR-associated protein Csb2